MDQVGLLAQLCLSDIGILAEMQLLKLLILPLTVRLDDGCNKEPLQRNPIVGKIGALQAADILRERRQVFGDLPTTKPKESSRNLTR